MRLWSVFRKSMREQLRGVWSLVLVLICAPLMILIYWLFLGGSGSTAFDLLVLNQDRGAARPDGTTYDGAGEVIASLNQIAYPDGQPILRVKLAASQEAGEAAIKNRTAAAMLVIPPDFSEAVERRLPERPATVTLVGDLAAPAYALVAALSSAGVDGYVRAMVDQPMPIQITEMALGGSAARTEFESYIPGLLMFSVILLVFQAAMTVAREMEAGTLRRLQMTRMTAFDLLGGISLTQVLIGVVSILLTFWVATVLGFHSQGPLWVAILVSIVTSLAVVGVSLLIACFARSVSDAFIYANFPLMLMMFFSGVILPLPRPVWFTLGSHGVSPFDILPTTHAVVALNKVLVLGAGLGEVTYEMAALLLLSLLYFGAGVCLFQRTRMRTG